MAFAPTYTGIGDNKRDIFGATEVGIWTVAFGAGDTYVAGGLALTSALFGLSRPLLGLSIVGQNTAALPWGWMFNTQTVKLQMLATLAAAIGLAPFEENPNATVLTGMVLTVLVFTQR